MKKIYAILIIAIISLSLTSSASDTLFFRFSNYYIAEGTPYDTMIFDIEIKSSSSGTYLAGTQLDIFFNTSAFGEFALPVETEDLDMITPFFFVAPPNANPTANSFRYARSTFAIPPMQYDPSQMVMVPTSSWASLVRYKMLVIDDSEAAGIQFNVAAMTSNQKFVTQVTSTTTNYVPITATNDLLTLATSPTNLNLMLSELGDPAGSNADFVEIYNAGSQAIDFSLYSWYLTSFNGNTYQNIQMTGMLAPGGTYVVAGPSFAAAYPGKSADHTAGFVESNGTMSYFLSLFGPYNDGIFIDKYDGSALSYTGKHAVRPFLMVSPNTTFTPSEWNVLPATNMDMTPGSHRATIDWDGSFSNIWRDTANWTPSYVPDAGHNANVPDNLGPLPVITTGTTAKVHNLIIDGNAGN
jgi:hypothetical protein